MFFSYINSYAILDPFQVIGKSKLTRLASLAKIASSVSVCVDSEGNIEDINRAANDLNVTIDLVVEVNVGQDRYVICRETCPYNDV